MATTQEKWQEIANRGLQDKFDPQTRVKFDEAVSRGLVTMPTQQAATQQADTPSVNDDVGAAESLFVSMGRGLTNVGRGVGIADDEDPVATAAFKGLQEERPITTTVGEIAGEVLPFLTPGLGVGAIASLPLRVAASAGLGGLEGGILSAGTGGEGEDVVQGTATGAAIAGTLEAIFPKLSLVGGAIFRRIKGASPKGPLFDAAGGPTPELNDALAESGLSFEDLVVEAQAQLAKEGDVVPEQASRQALFQQEGVPITQGELTQDFAQQSTEQQLLQSAADPLSDTFRSFKLQQSEAIDKSLRNALPSNISDNSDVGESIKDALVNNRNLLRSQKNALYKEAAEQAESIPDIPIMFGDMTESLPSKAEQRRIGRLSPQPKSATDDLMVEFGLNNDPKLVEEFVNSGGEVVPLSIRNFEEFRQAVNQIERSDMTGAIKVITGPLKNHLDAEADLLGETLQKAGITDQSILKPLEEARQSVRQLKTEFSPQAVTGRLIDAKRDGVTPVIEASKVYSEMLKTPENADRVIKSLARSGPKGKQAIGDIQSAVLLDLIDAGFGTQSRKIQGKAVFNPNAFNSRMDGIGERQLKSIFGNNKALGNRLKNMRRIATDLQPPAGAVPKGSANIILDSLNKLGITAISSKLPGSQLLVETLRNISQNSQSREAVQKAINASPEQVQMVNLIEQQFPSLASSLGIVGMSQPEQENK